MTHVAPDFATRRRQYQRVAGRKQQGWIKCYDNIHAALTLLGHPRIRRVLELGCGHGDLAVECLTHLAEKWEWHGYDIAQAPVMREHPGYTFHYLTTQIWDADTVPFDVFVSSHTIEHLYADEVQQLIRWLHERAAKYLILCIPLRCCKSPVKSFHVLDKGYEWLIQELKMRHFTPIWTTGGWFGWFKAEHSS